MGKEIRLHQEVKINNTWHHYSKPCIYQDYDLFNRLTALNGNKQKGLPNDATELTKLDFQISCDPEDYVSWLNIDEIELILNEFEACKLNPQRIWGYLFGNPWNTFKKYREDYPAKIQDFRFIFWIG